ncbi:MAG: hypothetical protein JNL98_20810 [Bryobacterales bacterium]|nr:hypothetical protein [Bryobacterales bacterium]
MRLPEPAWSEPTVEGAIRRLSSIRERLSSLGLIAASITIVHFILAFWPPRSVNYAGRTEADVEYGVALGVFAVLAVVLHEALRKQGDAIFEEISDEFHRIGRSAETADTRALSARITMRSFTISSDLPLVPGKFGPSFYAFVNIALICFEIVIVGRKFLLPV